MSQLPGDWLEMHEVAEARPCALACLVLSTTSLAEICDWCQFSIDWTPTKPSVVKVIRRFLRILFLLKLDVDISHQVVPKVIADIHLFNGSVFVLALNKHVFEEIIIVLLHLLVSHVGKMGAISCLGGVLRVDVQVLQKDRLRESGLVVDPRTSLTVRAGSSLEEKGAVDLILFCSKDAGQ